jgi:hypothetical protein
MTVDLSSQLQQAARTANAQKMIFNSRLNEFTAQCMLRSEEGQTRIRMEAHELLDLVLDGENTVVQLQIRLFGQMK